MSTYLSQAVVTRYAESASPLLFQYHTTALGRGVSLKFLSVYPLEEEHIYAPLTYLKPERISQDEEGRVTVEVTPQMA